MKRKYLSLLLCIAMLLSVLSACTSDSSEEAGSKGESDTPKVSDSQIEFDMPDLLEYLDDEEDFPRFVDFDHWEAVQHTYNEDMHADTVQVNLYYTTDWYISAKMYTVNLVYQYSRDNDLWTLIGNNGAEYVDTEYLSDLPDRLEGRYARASEDDWGVIYDDTTVSVSASIESVDTVAGTFVIKYEVYQDSSLIYDERETFDLAHDWYYCYVHFDYTLTDSRGYREPRTEDAFFHVAISEDSMDLTICL